jgi:tRNA (cytidine/uridine-2'-O-)-methyltransferase
MNIVLLEPEIPPNTGNVARLCAATKVHALHLIEPFGFKLDDAQLKRAGMDYWQQVEWHRWKNWTAFASKNFRRSAAVVCRIRPKLYSEAKFSADDYLVFGRETAGLPKTTFGTAPRKLAADSDVQRKIAFAEFVKLRRAGFVRGVAAAGIQGRDSLNRE